MHQGHRKRVKKRFLAQDIDGFDPINVLELILFFSIPREDTNPVAHRLLDRFGSFSGVLEATYKDLLMVEGVGEQSATLLKLMLSVSRFYTREKDASGRIIRSVEDAGTFVLPNFIGVSDETVFVVLLDAKGKVLLSQKLSEGTKNSSFLSPRKVSEIALRNNAQKVIIAHNHPGGFALPSQEDMATTKKVQDALAIFHIKLVDHIIVADNDYVSLAQSGLLDSAR